MITVLEWIAFGLSLLCVYGYGRSRMMGGILGVATATSFIVWGIAAAVDASIVINSVHLLLHLRNIGIAIRER